MSDKLAAKKTTLATVGGGLNAWLEAQRSEIAKALPRMIDPEQFIRVCLTTVKQDSYLMEADPISFVSAVFEAASAGLMIDGVLGQAYLVTFWSAKRNQRLVQLIPGYKGLMEMARRSGQIAKIEARAVRQGDGFSFAYGIDQHLRHVPAEDTSDDWTHVYAIAWYKDPTTPPQFEVMSRRQVMGIKARSAAGSGGKSPWETDEIAMAQKTVIRRLCKLLPLAVADQRIVHKDEAFDAGVRTAEFEVKPMPTRVEDLAGAPPLEDDASVDGPSPEIEAAAERWALEDAAAKPEKKSR